jgi:hypothetical protein
MEATPTKYPRVDAREWDVVVVVVVMDDSVSSCNSCCEVMSTVDRSREDDELMASCCELVDCNDSAIVDQVVV